MMLVGLMVVDHELKKGYQDMVMNCDGFYLAIGMWIIKPRILMEKPMEVR